MRKETIDIDILVTFSNSHRKIMQFIRTTSRFLSRIRSWNQCGQFRWTFTKVIPIGKRLKPATFQQWAKGSREAASVGPKVLHIHFCSLSNNSQLGAPAQTWQQHSLQGGMVEIQGNLRKKKLHRTNQLCNFLRGSFSNRDNVSGPIQFERESQPQHLKQWFFLKNRSIHFHINSTTVIRWVKQNHLSFSSIEIQGIGQEEKKFCILHKLGNKMQLWAPQLVKWGTSGQSPWKFTIFSLKIVW